jgi:hypothetical protein
VSRDLLVWMGLAFGAGAIVIYCVVLAMRPQIVRMLNGSGLFFSGLGLIQLAVWARYVGPSPAWFNAEVATVALSLAVIAQSVSVLRNRRAWDGVDRRDSTPAGA